jgi:hypothetical protein
MHLLWGEFFYIYGGLLAANLWRYVNSDIKYILTGQYILYLSVGEVNVAPASASLTRSNKAPNSYGANISRLIQMIESGKL